MYTYINDEVALSELNERVSFWTDDTDVKELFSQMYERYIKNNWYTKFDVMEIVDNDYINWCEVFEVDNADKELCIGDIYETEDYGTIYIEAKIQNDGHTWYLGRKAI